MKSRMLPAVVFFFTTVLTGMGSFADDLELYGFYPPIIVSRIIAGETTEMPFYPLQPEPVHDTIQFSTASQYFFQSFLAAALMGFFAPFFLSWISQGQAGEAVMIGFVIGGGALGSGISFYRASRSWDKHSAIVGTTIGSGLGILCALVVWGAVIQ